MKLKYQKTVTDQQINLDSLRPKGSYDNLIAKRNYSLLKILDKTGEVPERLLELRPCPCCGYEKYGHEFSKDKFEVVSCEKCGVLYVNPLLNADAYIDSYRAEEYIDIIKKLGEESHNYRRTRFGEERIDNIEKYTDGNLPKNLLEIGCSTGFLLEAAKERGWEATGIELNPSSVSFGRERGLDIMDQPLEEIEFGEKLFSAIAMYDVLEHLSEPGKIMEHVNALLRPDATVYIYVPNYDSASRELLGIENSHFIWPTHHLTYFTPITLKTFVESYGFETVFWETQGLDIDDWLWYLKEKTDYDTRLIEENKTFFQFVINASGYGKNLRLYAKKKIDNLR